MSTQDKGYYGEPPQYPQQAMPAYGQAPYGQAAAPYGQAPAPYGGQAASYQGGYPPPQQQPYGAPQPAYGAQPVQYISKGALLSTFPLQSLSMSSESTFHGY